MKSLVLEEVLRLEGVHVEPLVDELRTDDLARTGADAVPDALVGLDRYEQDLLVAVRGQREDALLLLDESDRLVGALLRPRLVLLGPHNCAGNLERQSRTRLVQLQRS